ncbi:MAG: YdeI/OmpD-associated family protein [Bacillota bacterium]|nr:YdeI/OmpD-associated family protein [Bacillota bacterium]
MEDIDGAYVEFPFDVAAKFGTQGGVKVVATFDGVEYRGSLVKMKTSCHIIGITKAIRDQIGKQAGDMVLVTVRLDRENRVNAIPDNLQSVLAQNRGAADFFHSLTANQKNKFIDFITVAKKQETADSRLEKVAQMLEQKEKMK